MLYFQRVSSLMHDINNNVVPPNISNLFTLTQDFHHYNTRSSTSGNFYMNYSRLNHHKNSFSIIGAKIWNSIPKELRQLPKHKFNKKINKLLFQILKNQDSYADLDTIIKEMKKHR